VLGVAIAALTLATAGTSASTEHSTATSSRLVVMPAGMRETLAAAREKVPSFSRQTGLACSACHYQFPQLTPFGRLFKLNGYSLVGLKPITEPNKKQQASLSLLPIPAISVMLQTSTTHLSTTLPGTQNDVVEFPQQLSLFVAGALTPHIGTLIQVTYSGADGTIGIDNSDIRYVTRFKLAEKDGIFGVTLHNNPTVQDVFNTTPAWGFPFIASDVTPGSVSSAVIDGNLGQQVAGLGAYGLWNNLVYIEATGYRTALQGLSPADSTATNALQGVAPYWRLALEHQFGSTFGMVGTYGMVTNLFPTGVTGPTNHSTDVGLDAQIEQTFGGAGVLIGRATWINEQQQSHATFGSGGAAVLDHTLNTARVNLTAEPNAMFALSLGYFSTTGTQDTLLYAPAAVTGSLNGKPTTSGLIEEFDFNPWENTRFGIQGTQFSTFNGGTTNYDGSGRKATGNNTLYIFAWVAF
jgi:hypothetical protein